MGHGVARFQRGNNAFGATQVVEGIQRFLVGDAHVLGATRVAQPSVLGAYTRVVQARADAVGFGDLAVGVLQHIGAVAVQHARLAFLQAGRVFGSVQTFASRLHTDQTGVGIVDIGVENAHGVAATTDSGDHRIRLLARVLRRHLLQAFLADHALEIAHHGGVGMRARYGTNDVERVVHISHPVAHGFVERVFQGFAARLHRHYFSAQQMHTVHIRRLALHVFRAHIDHTLQAITGTDGGGGHTVLASTRFGNHAGFAHALGQQGLAYGVVDFVRTGVVQVLALEVDLCTAHFLAHARCVVHRRGATHEVRQLTLELGDELGVVLVMGPSLFELVNGVGQGFGDESTAVWAKMPVGIGLRIFRHSGVQDWASAARTAATNARILSASLMPLALSTPELTSTDREGLSLRRHAMPSPTFAGVNPPLKTRGTLTFVVRRDQLNTLPPPP